MAYDLYLDKARKQYIGCVEYEELNELEKVAEYGTFYFFERLRHDLYQDHIFYLEHLKQDQIYLAELLLKRLTPREMLLVYKLLAIMSCAIVKNTSLYGLAD